MPMSAPQLDLHAILNDLGRSGITRLMVEGGSRVAASFLAADLVDEAWLYRSKTTIGADGVPALEGMPLSHLTQSSAFRLRASEDVGNDHLAIYERS
jgi:diaminohydroxyphosphoribosylaminopyrimidine deaminase/5-amino-6-(5-phosphoribosylamino)uracil reductase